MVEMGRVAERGRGPRFLTIFKLLKRRPRSLPSPTRPRASARRTTGVMVKVTSLSLWKWNGDNIEPTCLGKAEDVAEFGYFERGSVREMLTFISRTIVKRTQPGQRQSVEQDKYLVHVANRGGLVAIAVRVG
jgi:hypothetical protein